MKQAERIILGCVILQLIISFYFVSIPEAKTGYDHLSKTPYVDPKGYFRIFPPANWRIKEYMEDPRGKVAFFGPESTELRILVNSVDFDTINDLVLFCKDVEKRFGTNMNIEVTTFENQSAVKRRFKIRGQQFLYLDILVGKVDHNLAFSAPNHKYKEYLPIILKSIATYEPIQKAVDDDEGDAHVLAKKKRLAQVMLEQENYELAQKFVKEALNLAPNDTDLAELQASIETHVEAGPIGTSGEVEDIFQQLKGTKPKKLVKFSLSGKQENSLKGQPISIVEVEALNRRALKLYEEGRYKEAIDCAKRTLTAREKILGPEHLDVAESLNNLALFMKTIGLYWDAEPLYKRALEIKEKSFGLDDPEVAVISNNLANLYMASGEYWKAEPLYKRVLIIKEKALGPDHPGTALSLNAMAGLQKHLGNYDKAEKNYIRCLKIWEKMYGPEHPEVAKGLNNLALLYHAKGDYAKADALLRQSLSIRQKALGSEHPDVATCLNNLAAIYDDLGNYSRAEALHRKALEIRERALGLDHPDVAISLNNLANVFYNLGKNSEAEVLYKRAYEIWRRIGHPNAHGCLLTLGLLYLETRRIESAFQLFERYDIAEGMARCLLERKQYQRALNEFRRSAEGSDRPKFIIANNIGIGLCYEEMRDYGAAKSHFQKAIGLIEEQWSALDFSERQHFLSGRVGVGFTRLQAYEGMVRVILNEKRKGYAKEALQYAERVKSRAFLEMLAARGVRGKGIEDRRILDKERAFQQKILVLKKRISVMESSDSNGPKGEKERIQNELEKTTGDYEQFIEEVKLENSELASLISVEAAPIEKIQSQLDPGITLLEYYQTKDNLYTWLVTKDEARVHNISLGKKELENKVNDLLLPNISDKSRRPERAIMLTIGKPKVKETSAEQRKRNRDRFSETAKELYRLLVKPIESEIKTEKLIIAPHGVLHKVPFSALSDGKVYMCDKYMICVVPALSVIEYVVEKRNPDQKRLLAFANPVTDYVPLGFTEVEVKDISKHFASEEIYVREKATEGTACSRASSFDVIHFACHGEFNDTQPMQSGLLLAKDEDNDGYLQVHEVFGLDLGSANLVTLSACETALGKIQGGDDLVGLSRGFIYAGTPSLLATLWEVDDKSTALFMEKFYENWQKGMNKPEALREAQRSLRSMPLYQHPYYWGPFVMIGDWE